MQLDLELPFHRRAHVWVGTLPGNGYEVTATHTRSLPCTSGEAQATVCAVEISVPRGPVISYGLLGVRYEPGQSVLNVAVREGIGAARDDALVAGDKIRWGLTNEFAEAVLHSVDVRCGANAFPCGVLTFECAAFGEVGSSPRIFGTLADVLLQAVVVAPQWKRSEAWMELLKVASW